MSSEPTGWEYSLEDLRYLQRLPTIPTSLSLCKDVELRLDAREIMRVESQGSVGSCQGQALSSVIEWSASLQLGEPCPQLSAAMGYYESQRLDNLKTDRGSSLASGVRLATTVGLCEDTLWPYRAKYDRSRPANWSAVREAAAKYMIGTAYKMKFYAEVRAFLGQRKGGVNIGLAWTSDLNRPVVDRYKAGRGGGHAVAMLGLSGRTDKDGDPYIWVMNSWGRRFGEAGWAEWSPRVLGKILSHSRTVCVGMGGLPNLRSEPWDVSEWRSRLRSVKQLDSESDVAYAETVAAVERRAVECRAENLS